MVVKKLVTKRKPVKIVTANPKRLGYYGGQTPPVKKLPKYITSVEFPVVAIHYSEDERNPRIDYVIDGATHTYRFWSTSHKVFQKLKDAIGMSSRAWGIFDAIQQKSREQKFTIRFTLNQKDSFIVRLRYLPTGKLIQIYGNTYEGWGYFNGRDRSEPVCRTLIDLNKKNGWA